MKKIILVAVGLVVAVMAGLGIMETASDVYIFGKTASDVYIFSPLASDVHIFSQTASDVFVYSPSL